MELEKSLTVEAYQEWIAKEQALCIYFYQENCGICHHLLPKIKELLENNFPQLKLHVIEAEKNKELTAQIRMMSIPGILVYFEGNEYLRSNGLIAISELENKIKRPYQLIFE